MGAEAALWIFLLAAVAERRAETTPIYLPHSVSIVRADGETSKGMVPSLFRVEFIAPGVRATATTASATLLFSQAAVAHSCLVNQQVFLLNGATA